MNWILDHLQILIGAAGAIAWWWNQRRQSQTVAQDETRQSEATFGDPDLAERTRRIREDIQRKIEQRTRGYTQPEQKMETSEPVAPPPIIREVYRRQVEPPSLSRAAMSHLEAQRMAEILEQQTALSEQLRQAQEMKASALRRVQFENQVSSGDQAAVVARGALADDLSNPAALRRAFILREIIGPPVALR